MQTFDPVHSRISSSLPSAILRGRNGSAIACLAEPIRSTAPDRITSAIRSGLVYRPTATTGLPVASLIRCAHGRSCPSG